MILILPWVSVGEVALPLEEVAGFEAVDKGLSRFSGGPLAALALLARFAANILSLSTVMVDAFFFDGGNMVSCSNPVCWKK